MQSVNSCFKYIIILDLPPIISADLHMNYRAVNSHHFNPQARSIKRKWNEYKCFISFFFSCIRWENCTGFLALILYTVRNAMQCNTPDLRMHTKHMLSNRVLFAFAFRLARLAILFIEILLTLILNSVKVMRKNANRKTGFTQKIYATKTAFFASKWKFTFFFFFFHSIKVVSKYWSTLFRLWSKIRIFFFLAKFVVIKS